MRFIKQYLEEIPIPKATKQQEQHIEALVTQILALKVADATADTLGLEQQIDAVVFDLYGLTEEEKTLVEPGFRLSEGAYVAAGNAASVANNSAGA